jgi:hypothetical protein
MLVIDLKVGKFSYADAGQMHLYLNNQPAPSPTPYLIEDFIEPRLGLLLVGVPRIGVRARLYPRLCGLRRGSAPFNQLIEFTTIEPDPTTSGAVVDLNSLTL